MLRRFPDAETGLTYWDRVLLSNTPTAGPKSTRVVAHTLVHRLNDLDMVGDGYLFHRLRRMGDPTLKEKAVTLTGRRPNMRDTEVRLTDFGEKLLSGEANYVTVNGIDEWVGGIRLSSEKWLVWYRDGDTLVEGQ